ncbi:DUF7555 family protein [Haloterrigena alkaliphila]|uniref:Uncharacterized protein n=1 Tax=Haloterrigena alkaliphila TaxID=2816475 RepID=A0A8A2VAD2_9EURY|nr:hypothetical protein [Haloterrigena alkaliphila]QSW98036.1 hypothetical protein J0X25_11500 [Haloterrigena alkaliphila]
MFPNRPSNDQLRTWALVWLDALTYAVALAFVVAVGAIVLGVATGGGLVRAKYALFFAGFLLMGYASVRLWPRSPADLERTTARGVAGGSIPETADETRFQRLVRATPPIRWVDGPDPEKRMTPPGKLFLGSLLVLLVSYLMESFFGI